MYTNGTTKYINGMMVSLWEMFRTWNGRVHRVMCIYLRDVSRISYGYMMHVTEIYHGIVILGLRSWKENFTLFKSSHPKLRSLTTLACWICLMLLAYTMISMEMFQMDKYLSWSWILSRPIQHTCLHNINNIRATT